MDSYEKTDSFYILIWLLIFEKKVKILINFTDCFDHVVRGVLRFEFDRGVQLEPQNPYPSLRVILAKKGTHF